MGDPLEQELSAWFAKEVEKAKSDPEKYIAEHESTQHRKARE